MQILPIDKYLQPKPSSSWQTAKTSIVLGFGYKKTPNGMLPGRANEVLLEWILNRKNITNVLTQEGVWVAVDKLEQKGILESVITMEANKRLLKTKHKTEVIVTRIHKHSEIYVDTVNALYLSMERMNTQRKRSILLVAHDLQLQRAIWAWESAVKIHQNEGKNMDERFKIEIPEFTTPIPGSGSFTQPWTTFREGYKIAELVKRIVIRKRTVVEQKLAEEHMKKIRIDGIINIED